MMTLQRAQVLAWRLAQHGLTERSHPADLPKIVTRIGALQAQVMSAAELQAGARIDGLTPGTVQDALWQERTLVKTWAMRGTLHVLSAEELPLFSAAQRGTTSPLTARVIEILEITAEEIAAITVGIHAALDGQCLTREALADAVAAHTGQPRLREKLVSGWGSLLKPAAAAGCLCFGPSQGQNVTFVRPDQWLGGWREFDAQEALQEIVRRYLRTYGPATSGDFAGWWGMEPKEARPLFQSMAAELEEVQVERKKAWALAETVAALQQQSVPAGVRLLPMFDPYVVAAAELIRPCVIPEAHRSRVSRKSAWISPVVLVDGLTAGVWEYDQGRKGVTIKVEPFAPFPAEITQGIEAEAARLGAFLGAPVAGVSYDGVSF